MTLENILLIWATMNPQSGFNLSSRLIELLQSMQKYQALDLGMIALMKIKYRTIMLRALVNSNLRWNSVEIKCSPTSHHGRRGMNGHWLKVAYVIVVFN